MNEEAENPVEQSWLQKVAAYLRCHIFFVNFFVLNAVCLAAVGIYVKEKPTGDIIMIYNSIFLGCAILSQLTTRGIFAQLPQDNRHHEPYNSQPGSPSHQSKEVLSGKLEEVKDGSKDDLSKPIPVVRYDKKDEPSKSEEENDENDKSDKSECPGCTCKIKCLIRKRP